MNHWQTIEDELTERIERINAALAFVRQMREPLDTPDGDGYFAFDGRIDGSSVERLTWCVMVRRNSIDKELYVYRFGGQTFQVKQMIGKWYRLAMPWDAPPPAG